MKSLMAVVLCASTMVACAGRRQVPAPTGGHQPEPVAPVMMPAAQVSAPPLARAVLQHVADSAIAAPAWRNARWGILMVDAASGDTLYSHDADKLFMPASNQKLLTGAIALQVLGPDYQWKTPVLVRGTQAGTVLRGDLLVAGSGDPTVSDSLRNGNAFSAFDPVVDALKARGITRITGDIVAVGDAFPGISTGFGWEVDDLDEPYGAAVDELLFNEGFVSVTVYGGRKAGASTSVVRRPTLQYPAVINSVVTREPTQPGPRVRMVYDSVAAAIVLTGSIAVGDSTRITASYRHPNDAYRAALRERLVASGIRVDGKTTPTLASKLAAATDTLTTLVSLPLRTALERMQKPSQNQIAELLFRTSGLVASGDGSADSARAVAARTLGMWGVANEAVAYRDGSGMSRHDYVTPRAIVQVLDVMHRSSWGPVYRSALPLAGVDGTIQNRMKNTPAAGNANAKTGTVDKARSLSGYVTSADGRVILFSLLCNNFTATNRDVEQVQDKLVVLLASLRFDDGSLRGR
jgi:D-alanyl-D-alanine carboxypeptidase/D-alanyl-D-alanine-endopeptidase (penicillin-binding protein 4)